MSIIISLALFPPIYLGLKALMEWRWRRLYKPTSQQRVTASKLEKV